MDHNRARNHVPEAAIGFVNRDGDGTDGIEKLRVNRTQEISCDGLEGVDWASTGGDYSDMGLALSRGLTVPENFKQCEVTPVEAEHQEDNGGGHPFSGGDPVTRQVLGHELHEYHCDNHNDQL